MKKYRWGVIGCGLIVPKFVQCLENTGEGEVVAAASKSICRARRLQRKLHIPEVYQGYQKMLEREQLDAVYIATSHNYHFENAKLCLDRGLPVLVEKSFTRNAREAETLINLSRANNLFMMEAMWTRFNPATLKLSELLASGAIGDVKRLKAEFCVRMGVGTKMLPWNRMYNPHLAGGALLDLGVYLIAYARMIFGRAPERISGAVQMAWTGVDKTSEYHLDYGKGVRAELASSFVQERPRFAVITGTSGIIRVPHFSGTDQLTVIRPGRAPETVRCGPNGFEHEIREVHRCLREGRSESPVMPLDETLETMRIMDTLRAQWGMHYPWE